MSIVVVEGPFVVLVVALVKKFPLSLLESLPKRADILSLAGSQGTLAFHQAINKLPHILVDLPVNQPS